MSDTKRVILIDGEVTTTKSTEEWEYDFTTWLESRGEVFLGALSL